jgi:hypothetical protein
MKRLGFLGVVASVILLLVGCTTLPRTEAGHNSEKTLVASGYARFDDSGRLSVNHRWLSAQQAAKLNAFRGLADQLYYEPLGDNKTVGTQVIRHEVYRVYLDIYLRSAQATDYRTIQDSLKATLRLPLTTRFFQCMRGEPAVAEQCIREDGKLAYSRLGFKPAMTTSVNLSCGSVDCSDQFSVVGFSGNKNPIDGFLLDIGLYDTEWIANTAARTLFNQLLIDGFINAL